MNDESPAGEGAPAPTTSGARRRGRGGRGRRSGAASLPAEAAAPAPAPAAEPPAPDEIEEILPPSDRDMPPIGMVASRAGGTLRYDAGAEAYLFTVGPAAYRVSVAAADAGRGQLAVAGRVGEGDWSPLLLGAGMLYRTAEGAVLSPEQAAERQRQLEFRHAARGRILTLRFSEKVDGQTLRWTAVFRLAGRSLTLSVAAPATAGQRNYGGFTLGRLAPLATAVTLPGMLDPLFVMPAGGFFSAYLDRWRSSASAAPPAAALYRANTDGRILPIAETFYLTVSDDPLAPLPAQEMPPAPGLPDVSRRLVLDLWSDRPYAEDAERFDLLRRYGLSDLAVLYRNWQQFGYKRRSPVHYPASPERGTNDEFRNLVAGAVDHGWLFALREEYAVAHPDSPYWNPKVAAKESDGSPCQAPEGGCPIAANRMLDFARLESTKIQRNYPVNAAFADGHVGWSPGDGLRQVDADAANRGAASLAAAIRAAQGLLRFLRDVHGGPLFGTSGAGFERFDTQWTGIVDAAERPLDGGCQAALIVDYELLHLNPRMLAFGAGAYPRFFRSEDPVDPERVDWDAYRATEIALGRLGYLGAYGLRQVPDQPWAPLGALPRAFSEYYLLRALQERAHASPVVHIRYRAGSDLLSLAEALQRGLDLSQPQVYRRHAGGLEVWVNRDARATWQVRAGGMTYELPPNGWLAALPAGDFLAYSALVAGNRVDFCRCADYTFLNTRGEVARRIEGITADGAVALLPSTVAHRPDLLMVNSRSLTVENEAYRLSERADVSLRHLGPLEIEAAVLDSESGKSVLITFPAFTPEWQSGPHDVVEWLDNAWHKTPAQVQQTKSGLQLGRARPGAVYRVRVGEP